ncbi:MAG: F0F1 ATP synthase subunit epsilon [Elusimicrobia bacterium]|nr:F0F1 ATP synthase subunit epsilon [Elusimicrobiota bacterium]MBI2915488.1 F0F1 ATP synthase subunit epsilon [Elusimicrobiota bacterium]MBI4218280.1 F0F1 ATP synthase subunit epsilon [Elusimicrobiota bacterium]
MTEKKIVLEIVTPEKVAARDEIDFIALPAFEGECGILPGHTHLLAQLKEGELRIKKGDEEQILAISGGFAEVHPDKVEIFAETAEMEKEIDRERARFAAEKARQEATKATTPQDMAQAQAALRRALIRLRVSEGLSRKRIKQ